MVWGLLLIILLCLFLITILKKESIFQLNENVINLILIFWFVGTTILCIIHFLDSFQGILQFNTDIAYNPERADKLFYFRYYIALIPLGISYCLMEIKKYKLLQNNKVILGSFGIFFIIMLLFHGYVALYVNQVSYALTNTNLIGMFLGSWTENYKYGTVLSVRFILCTLLAVVILATLCFAINKKLYNQWLMLFLAIEIGTCIIWSGAYMGPHTRVWESYKEQEIINIIKENEMETVYIEKAGIAFLYQFSLPECKIYPEFDNQDVLICKIESSLDESILVNYEQVEFFEDDTLWIKKDSAQ